MEELSIREKNRIISAVSGRRTPGEAGLTTPAELAYYRKLWQEAWEIFVRGGAWPIFDLFEPD